MPIPKRSQLIRAGCAVPLPGDLLAVGGSTWRWLSARSAWHWRLTTLPRRCSFGTSRSSALSPELGGGRRAGGLVALAGRWPRSGRRLLASRAGPGSLRGPSPRRLEAFRRARKLGGGPDSVARRRVRVLDVVAVPLDLEERPGFSGLEAAGHRFGGGSARFVALRALRKQDGVEEAGPVVLAGASARLRRRGLVRLGVPSSSREQDGFGEAGPTVLSGP